MVLSGNEYGCSPVISSNSGTLGGLKPVNNVTHLEVMTVAHLDEGSDGMPGDDDMCEPSPSLNKDRDNMDGDHDWTTVNRKGQKSRMASQESRNHGL